MTKVKNFRTSGQMIDGTGSRNAPLPPAAARFSPPVRLRTIASGPKTTGNRIAQTHPVAQPISPLAGALVAILAGGFLSAQEPPPSSTDTLYQLGMRQLALGKYQEAEDAFRRVAEVDPANSRGTLGIAQVYLVQKRPADALRLLQTASEQRPDSPELHVSLATVAVL